MLKLLENAIHGVIEIPDEKITLGKDNSYSYYSELSHRDLWYYKLHLSINGKSDYGMLRYDLAEIDNLLRLSSPPFDGLQDAISWLGLSDDRLKSSDPIIDIKISPPVDLIFEESSLHNDVFNIALQAHPKFNTKLLNVALRAVPGEDLKTRLQIAPNIEWSDAQNNIIRGIASVSVKNSDSILAMLMIGNSTARRHWFLDPDKARNNRLMAIQCFDDNLKMIKRAVLNSTDSLKFENGISALLFLLGFSPCVQLETDSPDLIVQTPSGRLILVECTLKISDFSTKIGKLVDRRGALNKKLKKSGHATSIATALVCRLPRDQIAAQAEDLVSHNTILISQEQLNKAFDQVRFNNDPDNMLKKAESVLNDSKMKF